ncbi:hypothetical protein OS493_004815 [Desmophyllum pertusum]|uniref:Uncharacterized protein n=1 Tax=Desmophyllum pertusum TaxID=174260 RepID=A0A9W9ZHS9_9CNID|nr:hypothetical protein OS493_004815 [Desmophyllum pertusum]
MQKISSFSGSYLNIAELERKCRELKAVDSSSLSWRRNCSRKSTNQRKGDFNKSSLVDDILRRSKQQESEKNSSSKSRSKCTCPCQKLKESMEFGLSWNKMSSDDQAEAV